MISKRFSLLFFLKKAKNNPSHEAAIYLRITIDGLRAEMSTQRVCHPKRWNSHSGRLSGTKEDAKTINAYLDTLRSKVYEAQRCLIEANEIITAEALKNKVIGKPERPRLLLAIFNQHNKQMEKLVDNHEYAPGTLTHFETSYEHVLNFIKWRFNQTDIDINKINYGFLADLEFYLKTEKKCGHNTAMKYLGDFKKIVLLCVKNKWLQVDPFLDYRLTRKDVIKDFLVDEELEVIASKKFSTERLTIVRYFFIQLLYRTCLCRRAKIKTVRNSHWY